MIALLLSAAAEPERPPSTPATIEEVRRDPRHWDGQWVQIEGWINHCSRNECTLAQHLAARRSNEGMTLSFESQDNFDQWAKPMLPLRARVTARVDAACLVDQVCIGRAPVLRRMIVDALQPNAKFPDEDK